jgi:hypothetical protein
VDSNPRKNQIPQEDRSLGEETQVNAARDRTEANKTRLGMGWRGCVEWNKRTNVCLLLFSATLRKQFARPSLSFWCTNLSFLLTGVKQVVKKTKRRKRRRA